jgi:hypothetical protein
LFVIPNFPGVEGWLITDEWIYSLQKNCGPYDDWTQSNILADGIGCIDWRIPFIQELAGLIKSLA